MTSNFRDVISDVLNADGADAAIGQCTQAFSSFSAHYHAAGPSASKVTTLRRYTNLFIIIIIIIFF